MNIMIFFEKLKIFMEEIVQYGNLLTYAKYHGQFLIKTSIFLKKLKLS
jgi:hypothetical protein